MATLHVIAARWTSHTFGNSGDPIAAAIMKSMLMRPPH
jgi:hypothetical protein